MPNHTTLSTANYRVELAPHLDAWMQGDRYGVVQREYRNRRGQNVCLVLMDRSNKLRRVLADDVTVLS